MEFLDFYTAWNFLQNHKIFNDEFNYGLWTEAVKVNPETNAIDKDSSKNTKVQIWLEHGPYDKEWGGCTHDLDLDCGGDTFEDAIIKLAKLVKKYYTDNGERIQCDSRECANCGRFNEKSGSCGEYVNNCMQDDDAYSNWISKGETENE